MMTRPPQQPGYPMAGWDGQIDLGTQSPGQLQGTGELPQWESPPPEPKRNGWKAGVVGGVVFALLVGIGVVGFRLLAVGGAEVEAGECIHLTDARTGSVEYETVACGSEESDYRVARVVNGSTDCGADYDVVGRSGAYQLCLINDVKTGDCLSTGGPDEFLVKVACDAPRADLEVTAVADTASTDGHECSMHGENYWVYHEEELTICVART